MNPSDEMPLWQEIKRLRERLEATSERHAAEIDSIRSTITSLEKKLTETPPQEVPLSPMQRAKIPAARTESVKIPPPLPKASEPTPQLKATEPIERLEIEKPTEEPSRPPQIPLSPHPLPSSDSSFELDFGKVWFVRIGIVFLLTGLVFGGNYAYQNWVREMPNGLRLAALFACALALVETGRRLAQKESLNRFGEVLLAGGMAFFYYCTFAAHHVGRLQVIDSPVFAAVLLFGAAGAIAAVSWIRQAKVTAALGFVLAAYATMLQPIGWMSCVSNVLLGAMGLFFMLKPGWSGPGWASMLGSYGAFIGWQILGASGRTRIDDPAVLWFLPPLWAMFSIPGVAGQFRASLSERARAWFTAANNTLFFLLFSVVWLLQNSGADYWMVAAVFGPILIGLGIIGRRQDTTAGGVNISQGLAIATFAIVLKLEGHHLALTLAAESLALALAAWKYRGRSEAVFAMFAALAASYLVGENAVAFPPVIRIPIWSAFLVASFITAASLVTARIKASGEAFTRFLKFSAGLLFLLPTLIVSDLCFNRLGETSALLTAVFLSGVLSLSSLKLDTKRRQPEIIWSALWFLGIGLRLGFNSESIWPLGLATAVSLAACWLWHRVPEEKFAAPTADLARLPMVPAWAFSAAVPLFLWQLFATSHETYGDVFLSNQIAALAWVPIAIYLGCKRLSFTAAVTGLATLCLISHPGVPENWHVFAATLLALAAAILLRTKWAKPQISNAYAPLIFRATAFLAYCAAWYEQSPAAWSEWLAFTAILIILFCVFTKRKLLFEALGLIAVALVSVFAATISSAWSLSPGETSWRGATVVLALLLLIFTYRHRPALIADPAKRNEIIRLLAGLTCLITTVWATQMLVWRFDWKPAAVLWTLLGFVYVSTGLWGRLHIVRVSGFILLILSLGKLFVSDVWDFTAFMRVASFIVLGAALILLGLFYNKFAHAIKALLDDEKNASES